MYEPGLQGNRAGTVCDDGPRFWRVTLRNAHIAAVEQREIKEYLLNAAHPDNGGKASFFQSLGYLVDHPEPLIADCAQWPRTAPWSNAPNRCTARNMLWTAA